MNHEQRSPVHITGILIAMALTVASVHGDEMPPPVLNPQDYVSASGEYVLHVNPQDLHGRGAGQHTLSRKGKILWDRELPYTLWEARVTDFGGVAGYAYTHGWRGFAKEGGYKAGMGEFHVVIFDPAGREVIDDVHQRELSKFLDSPPDPLAEGMLLDLKADRVFIRIADRDVNRRRDALWVYRLSDGKRLQDLPCDEPTTGAKRAAECVVMRPERTPFDPTLPILRLRELDPISLQAEEPDQPVVRNVRTFDFDDQGRIGFLRIEDDASCHFVLITPQGKLLLDARICEVRGTGRPNIAIAWLDSARWVVVDGGATNRLWWIDTEQNTVHQDDTFECNQRILQVVGDRRGGFVTLTKGEFTEDGVIAFDSHGQRRWRVGKKHHGKDIVQSPEGIAVLSSGDVAVVSPFTKLVQIFDRNGKYLRTIDLRKASGCEPSYPTEVCADVNGGLMIGDSQASSPLWRLSENGKVRSQLKPVCENGRALPTHAECRIAPDGRVWVNDTYSLLRLTDKGVVDLVLGEKPGTSRISDVAAMTVDWVGRIYALDVRTQCIHVFDAKGKRLHVCVAKPTDCQQSFWSSHLSVDALGNVSLCNDGCLRFSPTGEQLGVFKPSVERIKQAWYAHAAEDRGWLLGYHDVYLVDGAFNVLRTVSRRPDGDWLENPGEACVAPDGSIAVVAAALRFSSDQAESVSLYGPTGDPLCMVELPAKMGRFLRVAYDGKRVVISGSRGILITDYKGQRMHWLGIESPADSEPCWRPYITAKGAELLLFDANRRKPLLRRFALPSEWPAAE